MSEGFVTCTNLLSELTSTKRKENPQYLPLNTYLITTAQVKII